MRHDFFQFSDERIETIEKLMQLHDMIPTIPDHEFRMSEWWNTTSRKVYQADNFVRECYSVGCVIGHGIHKQILRNANLDTLYNSDDTWAYLHSAEFPLISIEDIFEMFTGAHEDITKPAVMKRIMKVVYSLMGVNQYDRTPCKLNCANANPLMPCQCNSCKGEKHGAKRVSPKHIEMLADKALHNPKITIREERFYLELLDLAMNFSKIKLRRVA